MGQDSTKKKKFLKIGLAQKKKIHYDVKMINFEQKSNLQNTCRYP